MTSLAELISLWPIISIFAGLIVVGAWARSKHRTSIFAQDQSFEDVGISLASQIGQTEGRDHLDGTRELRPPLGARLIAPLILLFLLSAMEPRSLMADLGLGDPQHQAWAIYGFWVLFAYTMFELNVRQQLIYGRGEISVRGVNLRKQTRPLSELVAIEVHEKRPALVLTFADGGRLHAPKHLTGRDRFIADMESTIRANRAHGLTRPVQGLAARQGF